MTFRNIRNVMLLAGSLVLAGCSTFVGGNLAPEGKPTGSIIVANNSSYVINTITISRCSAMSYGLDILDGEITRGQSRRWTVEGNQCWDVQAAWVTSLTGPSAMAEFKGIQVRPGQTWRLTVGPGGEEQRERLN